MQVADRVAGHIEDFAAVAAEHGDDMVADMLTAEARILRADDMQSLIAAAQESIRSAPLPSRVRNMDDLRLSREQKIVQRHARAGADELIAKAWLLEGHSAPV